MAAGRPERRRFNPKRRIVTDGGADLESLSGQVSYVGNPAHKRNPGDFGLTPPAAPSGDKTLCDDLGIVRREEALRLLRQGVQRGLISVQRRGAFPQNVWAVTDDGHPVEAQLDNVEAGSFHGYPMPESDPFVHEVLERWVRSA